MAGCGSQADGRAYSDKHIGCSGTIAACDRTTLTSSKSRIRSKESHPCCEQEARAAGVARQAIPYCWMLFIVPMHLLTHELLLFATGIWTANIHDNIDGR